LIAQVYSKNNENYCESSYLFNEKNGKRKSCKILVKYKDFGDYHFFITSLGIKKIKIPCFQKNIKEIVSLSREMVKMLD
jgi:hypothetical protein